MSEETSKEQIPQTSASNNPRRNSNRSEHSQPQEAEAVDNVNYKMLYPDASAIFTHRLRSIKEIKDDCVVVLDTNVLLDPYVTGDEKLLTQLEKIYQTIKDKQNLVIPGHVAREFAKNRTGKLQNIYDNIVRQKDEVTLPVKNINKAPLLSSLDQYKAVLELEGDLKKIAKEYDVKITEYRKAVEELANVIKDWRWNDPVSELYFGIFDETVVLDISFDEAEIQKDFERRKTLKIPPGYKDSSKDVNSNGDLLIWHTILQVGKDRKKDIIFVSKDEKADWWARAKDSGLYPRYELVYEFMQYTGGYSFHLVKFSEFLKLYEADEALVKRVEQEETQTKRDRLPLQKWIRRHFNLSGSDIITFQKMVYFSSHNERIPYILYTVHNNQDLYLKIPAVEIDAGLTIEKLNTIYNNIRIETSIEYQFLGVLFSYDLDEAMAFSISSTMDSISKDVGGAWLVGCMDFGGDFIMF